jgi:hypothetical protein
MKNTMIRKAILLALAALWLLVACGESGKGGATKAEAPKPAATQAAPQGALQPPTSPSAASPATANIQGKALSCYEIGFRTGRCAAKSMSNLPCDAGDEIPMPPECKGKPETEKGLIEGRKSVF